MSALKIQNPFSGTNRTEPRKIENEIQWNPNVPYTFEYTNRERKPATRTNLINVEDTIRNKVI